MRLSYKLFDNFLEHFRAGTAEGAAEIFRKLFALVDEITAEADEFSHWLSPWLSFSIQS